jgi:hypothetical protein
VVLLLVFKIGVFLFTSMRVEFLKYLRKKPGDFYHIYGFERILRKAQSRETLPAGAAGVFPLCQYRLNVSVMRTSCTLVCLLND